MLASTQLAEGECARKCLGETQRWMVGEGPKGKDVY